MTRTCQNRREWLGTDLTRTNRLVRPAAIGSMTGKPATQLKRVYGNLSRVQSGKFAGSAQRGGLRSQALYLFVGRLNFLFQLSGLRAFWRIVATQCFSHRQL